MAKKTSVQFYYDYIEQLQDLDDKQFRKVLEAMVMYDEIGEVLELDSISKMAFNFIKKRIDYDKDTYNKKCEKNKQNIQNYWNERKQMNTNENERIRMNTKNTDIDIDIELDIDKDKKEIKKNNIIHVEQIIDYMNELAGTHFKTTTKKTQYLIKARLAEGFTVDEIKDVIYAKYNEWYKNPIKFKNGIMSDTYYRPDTLFGTKFEGYLESYKREYK